MRVPALDLRAQYAGIRAELRAAVDRVFESQAFVLGEEVEALERELAGYCEARHAVACGSGSDALVLALQAIGVGPGDQVLCPAFTFFATAGSIARLGATPVFADIEPASCAIDPAAAREAAANCSRLRAIVPVHLYGQPADLDALLALAAECGVPLIEDAAQAIGARDGGGRRVGARGRLACFSFYPSKNLGGAGEGGLVTSDDGTLADRVARLRVHGASRRYHHVDVGMNSRLDALQAAVLRVKLRHLEAWTAARRAAARRYDEGFAKAGAQPTSLPLAAGGFPLRFPTAAPDPALHVYHQYVVRVPGERREGLRGHLAERGIDSEVYYPLGLHRQPCFAALGYRDGDLPETERASRETLALPIYAEISEPQQAHVIASVVEFLEG